LIYTVCPSCNISSRKHEVFRTGFGFGLQVKGRRRGRCLQ